MALTTQKIGSVGGLPQALTAPTYVTPVVSETVQPGASTFLHVKIGATATTVTVDSVGLCSMGFDHDLTTGALSNTERLIGPIVADRFGRASDGLAAVTFSQVSGVTVAAISL